MEDVRLTHSKAPGSRTRHATVLLLAVTSGALDALGFLGLGGVFASVMTGNLVLLGLGAGTRNGRLADHAAVAIAAYVLGVAVGARLAGSAHPTTGLARTERLHVVASVELILVVGFTVGWEVTRGIPSSAAQLVLIALAAAAMGLQGSAIRATMGSDVSTTYLTGTLTGIVAALAGGRPVRDQWRGATVLLAALAGAGLGGLVLTEWVRWAPVVPGAALVGAIVVGRRLGVQVETPAGGSPLAPDGAGNG